LREPVWLAALGQALGRKAKTKRTGNNDCGGSWQTGLLSKKEPTCVGFFLVKLKS
jgi:hypothetical protein